MAEDVLDRTKQYDEILEYLNQAKVKPHPTKGEVLRSSLLAQQETLRVRLTANFKELRRTRPPSRNDPSEYIYEAWVPDSEAGLYDEGGKGVAWGSEQGSMKEGDDYTLCLPGAGKRVMTMRGFAARRVASAAETDNQSAEGGMAGTAEKAGSYQKVMDDGYDNGSTRASKRVRVAGLCDTQAVGSRPKPHTTSGAGPSGVTLPSLPTQSPKRHTRTPQRHTHSHATTSKCTQSVTRGGSDGGANDGERRAFSGRNEGGKRGPEWLGLGPGDKVALIRSGNKGPEVDDDHQKSVLDRDSPRAMRVLRSLLLIFLENDDTYSLRKRIDLATYKQVSGQPITNAMVHETCILRPDMASLSFSGCKKVDDVALWSIARHAPGIRELYLAGCDRMTSVGLRAIALRCKDLRVLDMTDCIQLEDQAVKALALLKDLTSLSFRNCPGIGDLGAVSVVSCLQHLTSLDLGNCTAIKNFQDLLLDKIGSTCHNLESLVLTGVTYMSDKGIKALCKGCPRLHTLRLSYCHEITGAGVRALAALAPTLTALTLQRTRAARQADLAVLFASLHSITDLDLRQSAHVSTVALLALTANAKGLKHLNLHACPQVDDSSLRALIRLSRTLEDLDVSYCPLVTKDGVATLVTHWTMLRSLNLTGLDGVSRVFLALLGDKLPLAMLADTYLGYKLRHDANTEITHADELTRFAHAVMKIQRASRNLLSRARRRVHRRKWIIDNRLHLAQALIRGHLARVKFKEMKHDLLRWRAARHIQQVYRGWRVRVRVRGKLEERRMESFRVACAILVQRLYRGHKGRAKVQAIRDDEAKKLLAEAQLQAAWEVYASKIQKPFRAWLARRRVKEISAEREAARRAQQRRVRGAVAMQRVMRGRQGRKRAAKKLAERMREILEWQMAKRIQTCWRIVMARNFLAYLRQEALETKKLNAIRLIQRAWRGGRGRYLAMLQRKLAKLRSREGKAAITIQKHLRGRRARVKVGRMHADAQYRRSREDAALRIEKVYRGHRGRERAEIEAAMDIAKVQGKPLFIQRDILDERLNELRMSAESYGTNWDRLKEDLEKFDSELRLANASTALYTDSSRIHGVPQRYLTKYLRVQLAMERKRQEIIFTKLKDKRDAALAKIRDTEKRLRVVKRELEPLCEGLAEKVKTERLQRLRARIRLEFRSARAVQKVYRGWRLRRALFSWYRDYWVECMDDATDSKYWFNTWSQQTQWGMPYEAVLSKQLKAVRGAGPELPVGWIRKREPKLLLPYYYNTMRNEFRWEPPTVPSAMSTTGGLGDKLSMTMSRRASATTRVRLYDGPWFDRQNKGELVKRSVKTRAIGYWEERKDPETGVTFYVQPLTFDARWSLSPRSALANPVPHKDGFEYVVGDRTEGAGGSGGDGKAKSAWIKVVDPGDNGEYYYNSTTGESQWEIPEGFVDSSGCLKKERLLRLLLGHEGRLCHPQIKRPPGSMS